MGVPMLNCTKVLDSPSRAIDVISSTPLIERTAASMRCVTCVSSSDGAAPGWDTLTLTAGKLMSGKLFTSMRMKLTTPASNSATNMTMGDTGLRMAQADILRKLISSASLRAAVPQPACPIRHYAPAGAVFCNSGFTF